MTEAGAKAQRARCLVVDDEVHNLDFLRRALEPEFEVQAAQSADEALGLLERQRFELVISDHRMPGLSGVELLQRASEIDPDMVRLMLTAFDDMPEVITARRRGVASAVLIKPTTGPVIAEAVRRWLAYFGTERANQGEQPDELPENDPVGADGGALSTPPGRRRAG